MMKTSNAMILKKKLYYFNYNIYYLFKKKIFKKKKILNIEKFINLLKFFKIFLIFNTYNIDYYSTNIFIKKYSILKVFWFFFLCVYKFIYKKGIKFFINEFFNIFIIKKLIQNLFFNYKSKKFKLFFKFIKLKKLFKFNILKKKINIKVKIKVDKIFKHKMKPNLKINFSFSIFNYYKKKLLLKMIRYFGSFYNFKIKKEFIYYWARYYKYSLKRIYKFADYILKYYIKLISYQYKLFMPLIFFKGEKIKKNIFFFIFSFNKEKDYYLKNFIINKIYNKIFQIRNFDIYVKTNLNFFFFNLNIKKKSYIKLLGLKKSITLLNIFIKMRFFFNLNNFIYLFFVKLLIVWLNFFFLIKKTFLIKQLNPKSWCVVNNFLLYKVVNFKVNKELIKKHIFKTNYFFYNNIIKCMI